MELTQVLNTSHSSHVLGEVIYFIRSVESAQCKSGMKESLLLHKSHTELRGSLQGTMGGILCSPEPTALAGLGTAAVWARDSYSSTKAQQK